VTVAATLALLALAFWLLPAPAFEALYGRGLYPALTSASTVLTGWTGLPLGLALLPLGVGIALWRTLFGPGPTPLTARLLRAVLIALVLLAGYALLWGINYRRPPLSLMLQLAGGAPAEEELSALAEEMLAWVIASQHAEQDTAAALAAISGELERLSLEVGWPASVPSAVKVLPAGSLLRAGYAGMLFPFTLEPQVDAGLTAASRAAIGAHELAHAAGFAAESDADLAALLAGLRADQPFANYATALSLLARMLGSLPAAERSSLASRLPEQALADLAEARRRTARYLLPTLSSRITAIYSRLLETQGIRGGVADYGQAPKLAALARRQGLLPPAPHAPELGQPPEAPDVRLPPEAP
jgi:hypothetical protein